MTLTIAHVDSFHKIPLESKRKWWDTLKHNRDEVMDNFVETLYFNDVDAW